MIEICYDEVKGMLCPAMYAALGANLHLPYWIVSARGGYASPSGLLVDPATRCSPPPRRRSHGETRPAPPCTRAVVEARGHRARRRCARTHLLHSSCEDIRRMCEPSEKRNRANLVDHAQSIAETC